jgi:DNA-binding LytR/AlgR family response regulator
MKNQEQRNGILFIPGYRHSQNTHLIIRLEGNGNYTIVHLKNESKPLIACQTLKYFQDQLPEFVRVSKSSLINPVEIDKIIRHGTKKMYLQLTDSVRVTVSRGRISEIVTRLTK